MAVFGVDGLTAAEGAISTHDDEALIVRTMMERARSSIRVAAGVKIGARALTSICAAKRVTDLVTTHAADAGELDRLRAAGVTVHLA